MTREILLVIFKIVNSILDNQGLSLTFNSHGQKIQILGRPNIYVNCRHSCCPSNLINLIFLIQIYFHKICLWIQNDVIQHFSKDIVHHILIHKNGKGNVVEWLTHQSLYPFQKMEDTSFCSEKPIDLYQLFNQKIHKCQTKHTKIVYQIWEFHNCRLIFSTPLRPYYKNEYFLSMKNG